jgi:NAD(P)-dependent dehydrogenase (short-subunit alcohol dehydrogenase family)
MGRMPIGIVTGASRGLGLALARELDRRGWRLVVDARDADALAQATDGLSGVTAIAGDVADPDHRHALVEAAGAPIELLVNNASLLGPSPQPALASYPLDELRRVYEVDVVAPLAVVQELLPYLTGSIVDISSDAAVEAYEGWGGYGSAKAAVEQESRILAAEEPAVRVWWVDPGDLRTRMHQEAFPGEDISDRREPSTVAPAFVRLLEKRPESGRIRLAQW